MALAKLDLRDVVVDLDGVLNAGGFVYSYAATTTTPLATYSDGLGTENTNPVVLDASGQWACYLTMGVAYRLDFADPLGVVFYTADNIVIADPSASSIIGKYITSALFHNTTPPTADELLDDHTFVQACTYPANFGGSFGTCSTAPTGSWVAIVKKNGVQVGTITVAPDRTYAFASTSGATVAFAIGDNRRVYGPASADGTINDFGWTFIADLDA